MQVRDRTYGQAYKFVQNEEYISDDDLDILRRFYYVWKERMIFINLIESQTDKVFSLVSDKKERRYHYVWYILLN